MDFAGPQSATVREFFIANALFWLIEYGFDGLRLDAVDRIVDDSSPDILDEMAARVRAAPELLGREVHLVLENDDNDSRRYRRDDDGRPVFFTAQWNDDAHHAFHAALTGESDGIYQDYADAPFARLGKALAEGFCYQGEASAFRGDKNRGTSSAHLPPLAFVNFVQNHDQIGNRGLGERLEHLIPAHSFEAALALLLLSPAPPLLFMGQEFAATTPFLFFCDLQPDLMEQVSAGRRREFASQSAFADSDRLHAIPEPGDQRTFLASCLDWQERDRSPGRERLALHTRLLRLRAKYILPLLPRLHSGGHWQRLGETGLSWRWQTATGECLHLNANLAPAALSWEPDAISTSWPLVPDRDRVTPVFEHPAPEASPQKDERSGTNGAQLGQQGAALCAKDVRSEKRKLHWPAGWVCCWIETYK
jgi:malto-oligosyltrehalose trehalohydrolase